MYLHNEWQKLVNHYSDYAYIPIETMESIDGMMYSLDKNGLFIIGEKDLPIDAHKNI